MNIYQILADAEQAIKDAREKLAKGEAEATEVPSDLDSRTELKEQVLDTLSDANDVFTSIRDGIWETEASALDVGDWESLLSCAWILAGHIASADTEIADVIEFGQCKEEN